MQPGERITLRFQIIRANLGHLRQLAALPDSEFLEDFRNVESAKHLLQTAIEAMIDVSVQLLASLKEPLPEHHAGVFEALARHGIVPARRVDTYRKMVGFRNRVVHLYDRVADRRVLEILRGELPDFETFISEIVTHLGPGPLGTVTDGKPQT
jgi:uncharacterized protein YutE (UPF0331/DUF86 family)